MDKLLKEIDRLQQEHIELKAKHKNIKNIDEDFQIKYIYK